jgi:hypothetical protein
MGKAEARVVRIMAYDERGAEVSLDSHCLVIPLDARSLDRAARAILTGYRAVHRVRLLVRREDLPLVALPVEQGHREVWRVDRVTAHPVWWGRLALTAEEAGRAERYRRHAAALDRLDAALRLLDGGR